MKRSKYLLAGFMAAALALAGCDKNPDDGPQNDGEGAIKISLASEFPSSRASEASLASSDAESAVKAFYVYIFDWESGAFERFAEASSDDVTNLSTTITGLPMGNTLRVVVIANPSANIPKSVARYELLQNLPIDLINDKQTAQDMGTTGLLMTGTSGEVTLTKPQVAEVAVTVSRVVAKVKLGSVTINSSPVGYYSKFALTGVSVQSVMPRANINPEGPTGTPASSVNYYGGVAGSTSLTPNSKLTDAIALPGGYSLGSEQSFDNYFYVLPNGLVGANPPTAPTLITLIATYEVDGVVETRYYPVVINKTASGQGEAHGANADASYIKPNYTYTAHIKLTNLAAGSTNPDIPLELADLKVDVVVAGWAGDIVQNDEF